MASAKEKEAYDQDIIFQYDKQKHDAQCSQKPWEKDVKYFKKAQISALAMVKMIMHAREGGNLEVLGLLQGKIDGDTMVVVDSFALPLPDGIQLETQVMAGEKSEAWMFDYVDTQRRVGREENCIGWYHSHPGYTPFLSGTDCTTQSLYQTYQEPWLAVVVDPKQTMSTGLVSLGAYRTYPQGYIPPDTDPKEYQQIPLEKIAERGASANRYYELEVSYYQSSVDSHLFNLLSDKYWVNILSSSPLLSNREYATGQMADLAEKLKRAETQQSQGKFSSVQSSASALGLPSGSGGEGQAAAGGVSAEKKKEETLLSISTKDSNRTSIQQVRGMMNEALKDLVFNYKPHVPVSYTHLTLPTICSV
eukprot:TRINITY_DN620_c0_g1_i1.p1 TRINITY_DN620_c0_g1~~TRINITY_DN620_c0_g1_i1.p1  ORF type:complete len:382 (-),score=108.38 TRINITY_DN620_c0_g1_i1:9-1097(-)